MSTGLAVVLGLLAGLAIGAVIVWAALSRRLAQVVLERDTARDESAGQRDAVAELRAELASVEADRAARVEAMAKQQAEIESRFKEIAAQVSETTRDAFMKEFRDLTAEQTKTAGKTVSELVQAHAGAPAGIAGARQQGRQGPCGRHGQGVAERRSARVGDERPAPDPARLQDARCLGRAAPPQCHRGRRHEQAYRLHRAGHSRRTRCRGSATT